MNQKKGAPPLDRWAPLLDRWQRCR